MRTAVLIGRFCFCLKSSGRPLGRLQQNLTRPPSWPRNPKGPPRRARLIGGMVMAALGPSVFLKLAEETDDRETTGEMQMLQASREEIRKRVQADARGLSRLRQELWVFLYCYVYDPIATGFRFLHLFVIFMPVVVAVPAIWLGRRLQSRNGSRSGTIWWYQFLVKAMERAGPAFIKVSLS